MSSRLTLLVLAFLSLRIDAQDLIFDGRVDLKRSLQERGEVYPVIHPANENIALFISDKNQIRGLLFNKSFQLIDSIDAEQAPRPFSELLGNTISGDDYHLYFASPSHTTFAVKKINFTTNTVSENFVELPMKREDFIGSASSGGKFYIVSVGKASSTVKLYVLTDDEHYITHTFDLNHLKFNESIYNTLHDDVYPNVFVTIDNHAPASLEQTSKKFKLYSDDNKIILSIDQDRKRSTIVKLDLTTLESDVRFCPQPEAACGNPKTNSYVHQNHLYQLSVCASEIAFVITDITNGTKLKAFRSGKNQNMHFEHSALVIQGNNPADTIGVDKTKGLLKALTGSAVGISAYRMGPGIVVMLGGYRKFAVGGAYWGNTFGGSYSAGHPVMTAFSSFSATAAKISFIKSLLDHDLAPAGRPVPEDVFDKAFRFIIARDIQNISAGSFFKQDDSFVLGYYDKTEQRYKLWRFKE